jgi:hypothetical protein
MTAAALLPTAGLYQLNGVRWRIIHSKRDAWYAMRQEIDGTWTYAAQKINPAWLKGPFTEEELANQPAVCATAGCRLPVWVRDICGMCLARQAVAEARRIEIR